MKYHDAEKSSTSRILDFVWCLIRPLNNLKVLLFVIDVLEYDFVRDLAVQDTLLYVLPSRFACHRGPCGCLSICELLANTTVQKIRAASDCECSEGCDLPSARSMYSSPDRGGRSWHGGHHMLQGKSVPSHQFGYSPDHSPLKSPTSLTSSTLLSAYGRMDGRKR